MDASNPIFKLAPSHNEGAEQLDKVIQILITIKPGEDKGPRNLEIESTLGEDNTNAVLQQVVEALPSLRPS